MRTIKKVEYIDGYKLRLYFSNKKIKIFDMENRLKTAKNMFLPLKDIEFFKKVKCEGGTIVWPNRVDLCPDTLHSIAKDVSLSFNRKRKKSVKISKFRRKSTVESI